MLVLIVFMLMLWQTDGEDKLKPRAVTAELRILGLFPYEGSSWNGQYVIPAARLARDEINNSTDILPNYKLKLIEANSGCSRDTGLREFVRNAVGDGNIPQSEQIVAVLGPGCSSSSIPIASVAGRDEIRIPQLSYGATSVFLSFVHSYPYFYRTVPTDLSFTVARVKLMQKFNWRRYGIHNARLGDTNQIVKEHEIATLRVEAERQIPDSVEVYSGESHTAVDSDYYRDQLLFTEDMLAARMRIGMLYGSQTDIGKFFCFLYHQGLIYPKVIWILSSQGGMWYNTGTDDCSVEEIRKATHGVIHFDYQLNASSPNDIITVTNKTFMKYYENYVEYAGKYNESSNDTLSLLNDWATVAYDSMWTLGLALDKAEKSLNSRNLSLRSMSLGNEIISSTILEELEKTNINGASGPIQFDREHKRELIIAIYQAQDGRLVRIGSYFPGRNATDLEDLFLNESALLWSLDDPPLDDYVIETIFAAKWAGIVMALVLVVGFIWNSFSLVVNFRYQHFHSIKASSPPLNYVIFAGNYMLLIAGIAIVIKSTLEDKAVAYSTLCRTHSWLFDLGLLLLLSTTLLKSWRIYRIFHSFSRKHSKMITDNIFIAVIIVLILLNTVYHIVYVLIDDRDLITEKVLPFKDQVRQRIIYCQPWDLWGLLYVPHFGMAVALCLLAFSIRKVKLKQFNDAANIAIFFYATTPVAGICAALSIILSPANSDHHLVTASLILECSVVCSIVFICQLTLFMPKMLPLFRQWRICCCHR